MPASLMLGSGFANEDAGTIDFLITVTNPSPDAITVNYSTSDGIATSPGDFLSVSGSITIPGGSNSATISITLVDDTVPEPSEYFPVTITLPDGSTAQIMMGTAMGMISDNDGGGGGGGGGGGDLPSINLSDITIYEDDSAGYVTIYGSLSDSSPSDVTVMVTTVDGTATAGFDYTGFGPNSFTIPAYISSFSFTIPITPDTDVEPDETFEVVFSSPSGAVIGDGSATVTILDDEPVAALSGTVTGGEGATNGNKVSFTLGLNPGGMGVPLFFPAAPVTVNYTVRFETGDTASAADFSTLSGSYTFNPSSDPGPRSAFIDIPIADDFLVEGDESFTITITSATGGHISPTAGSTSGTITDNDTAPPPPQPPVANLDSFTVVQNSKFDSGAQAVQDNDTDANGDTVEIVGLGTQYTNHGVVVLRPDGTFFYIPDRGYVGPDSFTYKIKADDGDPATTDEATGTVQLTVVAKTSNTAPIAVNDLFTIQFDHHGGISDQNVLTNDQGIDSAKLTDNDGDFITVRACPIPGASSPYTSQFAINPDGTFILVLKNTAVPGMTLCYSYVLSDGTCDSTGCVMVTVTAGLIARSDEFYLPTGNPNSVQLTIPMSALVANDSIIGAYTLTIVTPPQHGTLQPDPADPSRFIYTPTTANWASVVTPTDASGDAFEYQVDDNDPSTPADTANVTIFPQRIFQIGSSTNASVSSSGGIGLVGGVDAGSIDEFWNWFVQKANGGDIVILKASGASSFYSDKLSTLSPTPNSVTTIVVENRAMANDPNVASLVNNAEAVFIAGGDQARYINDWKGTLLGNALGNLNTNNRTIAGSSAGLAILGDTDYSAEYGSAGSADALADPNNSYMTRFETNFLDVVSGVITDTHFAERNRMGRLVSMMYRSGMKGIGVDEKTAVLIEPDGSARVVGEGAAYFLKFSGLPSTDVNGVLSAKVNVNAFKNEAIPGGVASAWNVSTNTYDLYARYGQLFSTLLPNNEFKTGKRYR